MKRFLLMLLVMMATTFSFASTNACEIASVTRTPLMEITANPENPVSPKQYYVREIRVIIEYSDGSIEVYYERVVIETND